jgi:hypothetical protein
MLQGRRPHDGQRKIDGSSQNDKPHRAVFVIIRLTLPALDHAT